MATAGEFEGSGTEDALGVAAAGGGATTNATSEDAPAAGVRGRHGAGRGERARYSVRREIRAVESSVVRKGEGGHEASGVAKNPRGDRQGVGGGFKSPQVIDTTGVE